MADKNAKEQLKIKVKEAKLRRGKKTKKAAKNTVCSVCLEVTTTGVGEVFWVACSACNSWMHYECIKTVYPHPYDVLKAKIVYCSVCHN